MNKDEDSIAFFESEAVRYARSLPIVEARRFLHGMLITANESDLPVTRAAYRNFCLADDQLELIACGQLKLNLGSNGQ